MKTSRSATLPSLYLVTAVVIAVLDVVVGAQISLWIFFLVPVGLATWNLGMRPGIVLAVICAGLILINGFIVGHPFSTLGYYLLAVASRILAVLVVVWLIGLLRKREVERVYTGEQLRPGGAGPQRPGTP